MTTTLTTSGAVVLKAGANAPTLTEAQYTTLINQAEGFIALNSKYDWVANFSSVPTNMKPILDDAASSLAATMVINYNMGNYTSKTEAQVMLDLNYSKVTEIINLIKESQNTTFVQKGNKT